MRKLCGTNTVFMSQNYKPKCFTRTFQGTGIHYASHLPAGYFYEKRHERSETI